MTGAGVVLAQRLEQLAEPDGVCIHISVYETVPRRLPIFFTDLGEQRLKGFDDPVRAYFVSETGGAAVADSGAAKSKGALEQEIRFCATPSGVNLAYATVGAGPPLVKTGNWMSHLEYDWQSPIWRHLYDHLADHHRLVRYDPRGNGLSDRDIDQFSLDGWVEDLEAVVDASGIDRFGLLAVSQGCPVAVAYAVRHPERLTHLVLYGGFAKAAAQSSDTQKWRALGALISHGWGQDNPAFRQMFTSMFMPGATREEMEWFNEAQRMSTSPHNARRLLAAFGDLDVTELLPRVETQTLVLHSRGDAVVPFESGRQLARIPGARFVPLEGDNHLLVEHEPAWRRFVTEVSTFLDTAVG
jgi:pimeloyl-ACP methyl ester carboxylesterase